MNYDELSPETMACARIYCERYLTAGHELRDADVYRGIRRLYYGGWRYFLRAISPPDTP